EWPRLVIEGRQAVVPYRVPHVAACVAAGRVRHMGDAGVRQVDHMMTRREQPQAVVLLFTVEGEALTVAAEVQEDAAAEEMCKADERRDVTRPFTTAWLHALVPWATVLLRLREGDGRNGGVPFEHRDGARDGFGVEDD